MRIFVYIAEIKWGGNESKKEYENVNMVHMSAANNGATGSATDSKEMTTTIIYGLICTVAAIILTLFLTGKFFVFSDYYGYKEANFGLFNMVPVSKEFKEIVLEYNENYTEDLSILGVSFMYVIPYFIFWVELIVTIQLAYALYSKYEYKIIKKCKTYSYSTIICVVLMYVWAGLVSGYCEKIGSKSTGRIEVLGTPIIVGVLALVLVLVLIKAYEQNTRGAIKSENTKKEEGMWRCSDCNTINPLYVGVCKCGKLKNS